MSKQVGGSGGRHTRHLFLTLIMADCCLPSVCPLQTAAEPPAQAELQRKVARQRATACLHSWRALLDGWSLRGRRAQSCLHSWPMRLDGDSHLDLIYIVFV
jgi:hypothetical protein